MQTPVVQCPRCGKPQPRRGPDAIYRCEKCGALHDGDPDEGGSHYNDPSKRLENQEQRKRR
jgi:ribosomal protein L37AE/L43A